MTIYRHSAIPLTAGFKCQKRSRNVCDIGEATAQQRRRDGDRIRDDCQPGLDCRVRLHLLDRQQRQRQFRERRERALKRDRWRERAGQRISPSGGIRNTPGSSKTPPNNSSRGEVSAARAVQARPNVPDGAALLSRSRVDTGPERAAALGPMRTPLKQSCPTDQPAKYAAMSLPCPSTSRFSHWSSGLILPSKNGFPASS